MRQARVLHVSLAFASAQVVPQLPQSLSVLSGVSQPLAWSPSQLPQPTLQLTTRHAPVLQLPVAFAGAHGVLQSPQFVLVFVGVSQPGAEVQSARPIAQPVGTHTPVAQDALAPGRLQATSHAAQSVLVRSERSQPLAATPSQSAKSERVQLTTRQAPVEHSPIAFAGAHGAPQAPQSALVVVLVSQPLIGLPSQSARRGSHEPTRQVPLEQSPMPNAGLQVLPHAPQWVSVFSGVSQPSAGSPLQSPKPASHTATSQVPVEQSPVAFAGSHAMKQPPQWTSVLVRVSHPFARSSSQSP